MSETTSTPAAARQARQSQQFRRFVSFGLAAFVVIVFFAYVYSRSDSAPGATADTAETISENNAEGAEEGAGGGLVIEAPPIDGSGMIPRPNSGVAPENPGDRGGYLQLGLLAVIVGGIGFIGFRVVREGQRNLEAQRQA